MSDMTIIHFVDIILLYITLPKAYIIEGRLTKEKATRRLVVSTTICVEKGVRHWQQQA